MVVGAGLYMYNVVVKMFTFAISSPDEFLSQQPKRHVYRFSRFAQLTALDSLYFTMGRPFATPSKVSCPMGVCRPHLMYSFLNWTHSSPHPKRHHDRFSRFTGLMIVIDRPTDRCYKTT